MTGWCTVLLPGWLGLEVIFLDFLVERVPVDSQPGRGFRLHSLAASQHLLNQFPLDLRDDALVEIRRAVARRLHPNDTSSRQSVAASRRPAG